MSQFARNLGLQVSLDEEEEINENYVCPEFDLDSFTQFLGLNEKTVDRIKAAKSNLFRNDGTEYEENILNIIFTKHPISIHNRVLETGVDHIDRAERKFFLSVYDAEDVIIKAYIYTDSDCSPFIEMLGLREVVFIEEFYALNRTCNFFSPRLHNFGLKCFSRNDEKLTATFKENYAKSEAELKPICIFYIVMEKLSQPPLSKLLLNPVILSNQDLLNTIVNQINGLISCLNDKENNREIYHNDETFDNILYDLENMRPGLIDFGLSSNIFNTTEVSITNPFYLKEKFDVNALLKIANRLKRGGQSRKSKRRQLRRTRMKTKKGRRRHRTKKRGGFQFGQCTMKQLDKLDSDRFDIQDRLAGVQQNKSICCTNRKRMFRNKYCKTVDKRFEKLKDLNFDHYNYKKKMAEENEKFWNDFVKQVEKEEAKKRQQQKGGFPFGRCTQKNWNKIIDEETDNKIDKLNKVLNHRGICCTPTKRRLRKKYCKNVDYYATLLDEIVDEEANKLKKEKTIGEKTVELKTKVLRELLAKDRKEINEEALKFYETAVTKEVEDEAKEAEKKAKKERAEAAKKEIDDAEEAEKKAKKERAKERGFFGNLIYSGKKKLGFAAPKTAVKEAVVEPQVIEETAVPTLEPALESTLEPVVQETVVEEPAPKPAPEPLSNQQTTTPVEAAGVQEKHASGLPDFDKFRKFFEKNGITLIGDKGTIKLKLNKDTTMTAVIKKMGIPVATLQLPKISEFLFNYNPQELKFSIDAKDREKTANNIANLNYSPNLMKLAGFDTKEEFVETIKENFVSEQEERKNEKIPKKFSVNTDFAKNLSDDIKNLPLLNLFFILHTYLNADYENTYGGRRRRKRRSLKKKRASKKRKGTGTRRRN